MELTPKTLREVEFREKLRGYHPDDVDEFLEQVAVAVGELLERLSAAEAGFPTPVVSPTYVAPAAPPPPPAPAPVPLSAPAPVRQEPVTDDTLRRTLLLAQRTADLAVAEAEETARQIVARSRDEGERLKAEATQEAEDALAEVESRRVQLEREVAALQAWVVEHRDRLRASVEDHLRSLDTWLAGAANRSPRPVAPRLSLSAPARRATVGSLGTGRTPGEDERVPAPPNPDSVAAPDPPPPAAAAGAPESGPGARVFRRR